MTQRQKVRKYKMGRKRKQSVFAIFLILFSSFFSTVEYAGAETQNGNDTINMNCEDSDDTALAVSGGVITSGGGITSGSAVISGGAVTTGSSVQATMEPSRGDSTSIPEIKGDATMCPTMVPGAIPMASLAPVTKEPAAVPTREPAAVPTKEPVATTAPIVSIKPEVTIVPEITRRPVVTKTPVPTATPELPVDATPIPTSIPTPEVTIIPTENVEAQRPSKPTSMPVASATQKPSIDYETTICT